MNNVKSAEVARATGISQQTISAWKSGEYSPKTDKRRKIADYFNVPLSYLDGEIQEVECPICGFGYDPVFDYQVKEHDEFHFKYLAAQAKYGFIGVAKDADQRRTDAIDKVRESGISDDERLLRFDDYLHADHISRIWKSRLSLTNDPFDVYARKEASTISPDHVFTQEFCNKVKEVYGVGSYVNTSYSDIEATIIDRFRNADERTREIVCSILKVDMNPNNIIRLAYYGKIAAAGTFVDSYEMLMNGIVEVKDSEISRKADYAIGVCGDSMEPKYRDGDIVLVRKTRIIDYGDVGIFQYNGDIYIKELSRDGLKSLNDRYPVIKNNDDIRCLGHVIGKAEMIK